MLGRQLSRQLSTQLSVPLPVLQEGAAPIHRVQGVWRNLEEDLAEPMRTERLLSRSLLNPFHARSTDCQHAMMPHLLIGTSGRSCVGLLSAWLGLVVQVAVGALSGIAPYLTAGDTGAKCQVLALGLLRLLWASVAVTFRPCADLVKNAVCACAFASEGTAAVLLYLAEWHDGISADAVDSLRLTSSLLLLIPVFLPIAEKVYDGVVVKFVLNCVRKKFDWAAFAAELCLLVTRLPSMLARFAGFQMSSDVQEANSGTSKMGSAYTRMGTDAVQATKAVAKAEAPAAAAATHNAAAATLNAAAATHNAAAAAAAQLDAKREAATATATAAAAAATAQLEATRKAAATAATAATAAAAAAATEAVDRCSRHSVSRCSRASARCID